MIHLPMNCSRLIYDIYYDEIRQKLSNHPMEVKFYMLLNRNNEYIIEFEYI